MLAPISWRTPPRHYGPWELATSLLTEYLVKRGHDVTLFATLDSETAGTLQGICPRPYSEDDTIDPKVWEILHVGHFFEQAGAFDILHNQADFVPLAFSRLTARPLVTTIHGFSSPRIVPAYAEYQEDVHYVAISEADRHPDLRYAATIHHGIELDDFPFDPAGGDYALFFGRIHPDKGAKEAIGIARAAGLPLVMAGIVQDEGYFEREVKPALDSGEVQYLGPVGGNRRAEVLGGARVLLHPINFDEPFGLSIVEAMACGTPTVATARGSMPELIEHGRTGFLTRTREEAVAAVLRAGTIDRAVCRQEAERRFGADRMAADYEALYERILHSP